MVCKTSCAVAFAFLGAMAWTMFNTNKGTMSAYTDTLDDKQRVLSHAVSKNRAKIWLHGILFGLVAGFLYLHYSKGSRNLKGCLFAAIVMGVNYFYYTLADKGTYMIQHLRKDQIDEWLAVKTMMQTNYHVGALLGIAGCFFLGRGLAN
jgi:hypothetical protein